MEIQDKGLCPPLHMVQDFNMEEAPTDLSDRGSSAYYNVNHDNCTSPDIDLETEISVSGDVTLKDANGCEADDVNILTNFPPEILRGKYSSLPGKKPKPGLNLSLPPISKIEDIFDDISINAERYGFNSVLEHIGSRELRVATMCSGTEAPLLALEMVIDSFKRIFGKTLNIHHLFSAEIDPFKQSYIQRNFSPDIIFRDVNELIADDATTAFGSLRKVPADLDLLIVGFSCVDFSNMNLHRKTLDEMGESGHTFYGVLRYIQRCRPPMVILENVCGAPWNHIKDAFKEMDYHAYHVKVDTKNYYLPQTRERGYMLCIDQTTLVTPAPEDSKPSAFAKMMKNFERPASSPVTQFLLKNDDPRLQDAIDDISSNPIKDRQAVDWTRYKARHLRYRMREGLGDKRPLTRWQGNGTCQMPDFYWHGWSKAQTERVWDTLDVNFLRSIIRGFDISFKSRIIDLSQGIDRELDQRASGIAGCLTPRGQHFVTSRGGPLLGIESLALQGIPIDRLLLSNDSQRDLNDLAGNAMSSTVVGAAIMSALIIGYKALSPNRASLNNYKRQKRYMPGIQVIDDQAVKMAPVQMEQETVLSLLDIFDVGKRSSRLCICEGQVLTKRTDMLQCLKCGLTACKSCGRNPPHAYSAIPKDQLKNRVCPTDFETQLKKMLPMRLQVSGLSFAMYQALQEHNMSAEVLAAWDDFYKVFLSALGDELRFQGVTRQRSWTVTYQGTWSVLKLICSSVRLQWFLYLIPSKDEPSNSPLRQILLCPIASVVPSGMNILNGTWRVNSPVSSYFDIAVSGKGNLVPSIGSRAGLKHSNFASAMVWNQINISATDAAVANLEFDLRGDYELLQDCGAASGSLHKKIPVDSEPPIYFFLDPTEIGSPEFDSWVFALDHGRLGIGESRITIAEVRPNWDASIVCQEPKTVRCWFRKTAANEAISLDVYLPSVLPLYQIPTSHFVIRNDGSKCLDSYTTILTCSVPASGTELALEPGTWAASNLIESPAVLKKLAWLLQRASFVNQFGEWSSIVLSNEEDDNRDCSICAPRKPRLMWTLDDRDHVCAYENPEDAAIYEQNIKKRPAIFLGFTSLGNDSVLHVKLCLNVMTLIHQAKGKLVKKHQVSLKWRFCIDNIGFLRQRMPPLKEKNNKDDPESAQPPGFKFFNLRPEQLRSLTWMKEQENVVQSFVEEEVVEAMLPALNWRAEAKATTEQSIRGGILGDDVGYGKTAISLGLIDSQFVKDSNDVPDSTEGAIPIKATLIVVPQHLIDQWSHEITKFLGKKYNVLEVKSIASLRLLTILHFETADIILVSTSVIRGTSYYDKMELFASTYAVPKGDGRIFDEWLHDTMIGVRDHVNMLMTEGSDAVLQSMIRKQANLLNSGIYSKFKPSRRLKGQKFKEHLLKLKEKLQSNGADNSGTNTIDINTASGSTNSVLKLQHGKRKRMREDDEYQPDITTSGTQTKKAKGKTKSTNGEPSSEADKAFQLRNSRNDWRKMHSPLIHMFEYSRIVIDEFTYSKDRNYSSVLAIPARSKWILSGTPPLNGFADVKSFSPFLGITLGVDDEESGKTENERLKAVQREQTDAEQFQPFVTRHSAAWHQRRHGVAQNFLIQFMRKNSPGIDEIPWTEHICTVVLASRERAAYLELFMQLMSQNLKLRRNGRGLYDLSAISRNDAILGNSSGPEEALLKCSSYFVPLEQAMGKQLINKKDLAKNDDSSISSHSTSVFDGDEGRYSATPETESTSVCSGKGNAVFARDRQFDDLVRDIFEKLRHAFWLRSKIEGMTYFDTLVKHIEGNGAGDLGVTECFQKAVADVQRTRTLKDGKYYYSTPQEKKQIPSDIRLEYPKTPSEFLSDLNSCTDSLRRLVDETLIRVRAARLFNVVRSFQVRLPDDVFACSSCFRRLSDPTTLSILGECGHAFCEPCIEIARAKERCRLPACGGNVESFRIIKYSDVAFVDSNENGDGINEQWQVYGGTKFLELIRLVRNTDKIPADEHVLLFIQFPDLMKAASAALGKANIPHLMIPVNDRMASSKITEFQKGTEKVKSKVLILHLGNVSASGLNLQNANHVIFFHPLFAKSQYDYTSGMAQAIGRSRRYGQQKHVHIYQFLALKTIEVNIFEHRRRERLVKRDGQFISLPITVMPLPTDEAEWRGSSLDGSNAADA
ncbi:hypothetical protein ACO22_00379 [Paracoccidioides brasiliensis]|uniref:RING-type domain-containing protein n=1 Tax=Paracoccidioides brasiliensis TaxID=121759 RepID=A0A1D2JPS7_PARBR|nr:hypothetical protein ACO22_00379 [Paracoccidioides brasiliensis]